ncbi:MAG: EAL domain-containing protein [Pseudomonadota bacterium]
MRSLNASLLMSLLCLLMGLPARSMDLALAPDPPFRVYTVADGLNQRTVLEVAQDQDGYLWITTFGGLNRFDGQRLESLTTRQGMRLNQVQSLLVDEGKHLWVGDVGGGLTLLRDGQVVRTVEPLQGRQGVVRALLRIGDILYYGLDPGGLASLDLREPGAQPVPLPSAPSSVLRLAQVDNTIIALARDGLYRLRLDTNDGFEMLLETASGLRSDRPGEVLVGNEDGRIGHLRDGQVQWHETHYPGRVTEFGFDQHGDLGWVLIDERTWLDAQDPADSFALEGADGTMLFDHEEVLWIPTRHGLARYLGDRFRHYGLELEGARPEVFAIQPGTQGDVWFGTNDGLIHVDRQGRIENISKTLGIERAEVRGVAMSADGQSLWAGHVGEEFYHIDLPSLTATPVITGDSVVSTGLDIDPQGRVWIGSFRGALIAHDPSEGSLRRYPLGAGAAVYGIDSSQAGEVWFTANQQGLYRLDSRQANNEPELIVTSEDFAREFFTQVVVDPHAEPRTVWVAAVEGGVFRWTDGRLERFKIDAALGDYTVYALHPLADGTVVLATSRGAYRFDPNTGALDHYTALDGFVSLEAKAHATYFDGDHTLWIGTTSGVTAMDVRKPPGRAISPRPLILRRLLDGELHGDDGTAKASRGSILVDFSAISMRRPEGIEYSYYLDGQDELWSEPTRTTSIGYSSLAPGEYRFSVRARSPGSAWSDPVSWSFTVPTPFWRTYWFAVVMTILTAGIAWAAVQLRLRSIQSANERLRLLVAQRTASIDAGRHALEAANGHLSQEIEERQRADAARADIEARFRQAYRNSPIGMALVDTKGIAYEANPKMKTLFWPDATEQDVEPLISVVVEADRTAFIRRFDALLNDGERRFDSMEVDCLSHAGDLHRIDFLLSPVRNGQDVIQYVVVLAQDVTQSRAMTRQLEFQASYDELTGLLNRRAFKERLAEVNCTVPEQRAYLVFLDLDQFKVVNDTCGHAAGDELLRMVGQRITDSVRKEDVVARLGGDEFALILVDCPEDVALDRAEKIRVAIQDLEFLWESDVFRIGASVGLVPLGGSTHDIDELQQIADAACYAAKDAGRNRIHLVSGNEDAVHARRGEMRWVQRLNQAIDTDSFVLYGQRIVPLNDIGAERIEVLLRMIDRSTGRLIPPGAFLPAAERYGLQSRLDQWVVNQVIDMLSATELDAEGGCELWVNLSGASVGEEAFSRALLAQMQEAELPSGSLNFEITETAVIRQIDGATALIEALRCMGSSFALDDFGSGLSSFGYLKRLQVDCVKIDGQFVRDITTDPTDRIFVKSIIDIAHTLNMQAVAEFVEDDEVLAMVQGLGSDYAQGFGVHRPQPLDQLLGVSLPAAKASDSA